MDFRLKVFLSVSKNLSFTKASKELFISQPAITKHIQELENTYNVQLFIRHGSKVSLSNEGEVFAKCASRILAEYDRLSKEIALKKLHIDGNLSIAVEKGYWSAQVLAFLSRFMEKNNNVDLTISLVDYDSALKVLESLEADVCFLSKAPITEGFEINDITDKQLGYMIKQPGNENRIINALTLFAGLQTHLS